MTDSRRTLLKSDKLRSNKAPLLSKEGWMRSSRGGYVGPLAPITPCRLLSQATPSGQPPEAAGVRRRKCALSISGASRGVYPHFSKARLTLGQEGSCWLRL